MMTNLNTRYNIVDMLNNYFYFVYIKITVDAKIAIIVNNYKNVNNSL